MRTGLDGQAAVWLAAGSAAAAKKAAEAKA